MTSFIVDDISITDQLCSLTFERFWHTFPVVEVCRMDWVMERRRRRRRRVAT